MLTQLKSSFAGSTSVTSGFADSLDGKLDAIFEQYGVS